MNRWAGLGHSLPPRSGELAAWARGEDLCGAINRWSYVVLVQVSSPSCCGSWPLTPAASWGRRNEVTLL